MVPAENMDLDSGTHGKADLLRELGELALRSMDVDATPATDSNAIAELTHGLIGILETGIELIGQLEQLAAETGHEDDDFSNNHESTWIGAKVTRSARAPRLSDLCFAATLELGRARSLLVQAQSNMDRLVAAEAARRKLHRALYAVLVSSGEPAGTAHESTTLLRRRFAVELESALIVRRLFASFRRALRRAESRSSEAVLMALRYAAGALATLATSAHHGAIRLPDRALLSKQRDRLLDWSRGGRPVASGLQLLEDIWTCADLLRDINRRQELHTHDQELIRELLHPSAHGSTDWVTRLERLSGLDDELDVLIARSSSKAQHPDVTMDVLLRLSCMV